MLIVSNYHYVRDNFDSIYPSIVGITPNEFRKQLVLLKNQGDFINPNYLVENLKEVLESKYNYFLITFDDGLKEQFKNALPIMDELNVPALFL